MLLGFSLLAKFFEHSGVPDNLSRLLPRRPILGAFTLLALVWVISSFLDNIAAAMIGGVMARSAFRERVTVGYVAALVAASNAGGAWSVLGDTTTTMMWLDGVSPLAVLRAIVASAVALVICGVFGAVQQSRVQAIEPATGETKSIDRVQVMIVVLILAGAIGANFLFTGPWAGFFAGGPWYGVWAAILVGALLRRPAWDELPGAAKGALFLLSLVWCASLMPVRALPGVVADGARARLRVRGVRQHPADEAGARAERLRLGPGGVQRRVRRVDDLVRLVGRGRHLEGFSGGPAHVALPEGGLAGGPGLRSGVLRHAADAAVVAPGEARRVGSGRAGGAGERVRTGLLRSGGAPRG
ncbi:hypothetical protein [Nannocystis pusilla]|uniref:hypothetical protein n=1 Tax=Nannocystis pusilla TaxID=889268 RepID=UPI003B7D2D5B